MLKLMQSCPSISSRVFPKFVVPSVFSLDSFEFQGCFIEVFFINEFCIS